MLLTVINQVDLLKFEAIVLIVHLSVLFVELFYALEAFILL